MAVSDTLRTSKSVCPSTSRLPFASILLVNVVIPDILTLPSTVSAASAVVVPIPTLLDVLIPVLFVCQTVRLLKTPAFASTH